MAYSTLSHADKQASRYPDLGEFWPTVRARNFVKEMGLKTGNYRQNMATLAARARVAPEQMWHVNPLTFADRHWEFSHKKKMIRILGNDVYTRLETERLNTHWGSATWAYHKKEPIPPYNPWWIEEDALMRIIGRVNALPMGPERVPDINHLFTHILRIEPFLRAHPAFCDVVMGKVEELKTDPHAESVMESLLAAEKLLTSIRAPAPAP
jgi:hypothetical protein